MARLLFGGDDVSMRGPYGSAQLNASGRTGIVYADATTSALADIVTYPGGAAIAGSVITVTADSQLPLFQGPADGTDTLYVSVDGGTRTPIYTNVDARLDLLATSVGTKASVTYVDAQDAAEAVARAAADGTRLNWRGAWAATTAYAVNDLVTFNGGLYRAPSNFTSGGSFVLANWVELVAQTGTYVLYAPAPSGDTTGATDRTAIQALLNTAGAKQVRLRSCTTAAPYYIDQSLGIPSDTELIGAGRRNCFIKAPTTFANNTAYVYFNGVSRARVADLGFLSAAWTYTPVTIDAVLTETAADIIIERCWMDAGFGWAALIHNLSAYVTVSDVVSDGTVQGHNIELTDARYCTVQRCHLKSPGGTSSQNIELWQTLSNGSVGLRIVGNVCENATGSGILADGALGIEIEGNRIVNPVVNGISVQGSTTLGAAANPARRVIVKGNIIDTVASPGEGIWFASTTQACTIADNSVTNVGGTAGIDLNGTGHTVHGNTVALNGKNGISVSGTSHTITGNSVLNNSKTTTAAYDGILLQSNGHIVIGNTCTDNQATKTQRYGVFVGTTTGHTIVGNILAGNGTAPFDNAATGTSTQLMNVGVMTSSDEYYAGGAFNVRNPSASSYFRIGQGTPGQLELGWTWNATPANGVASFATYAYLSRFEIDASVVKIQANSGKDVTLGKASPATTATAGFPFIPAGAGPPTGVPAGQSGFVPFYYDTTNHKLWIYDSGWKGAVVS